jgi:phage baseplate assembly protein V
MTDMISRGKVRSARVRGGRVLAEIENADGELRTRVEIPQPMGITAVPEAGADVVVLQIGGPDHLVALQADDARLRAPGLSAGDIALRDKRGQQVVMNGEGVTISGALKVTIVSAGDVEITAPKVTVTGDMDVSGTLTLTGPGVNLNTHIHGGVETGGSNTTGPA